MVFVTSYISGQRKVLMVRSSFTFETGEHLSDFSSQQHSHKKIITCKEILDMIHQKERCCKDICLSCEGKPVGLDDEFEGDSNIVATLKLRGGKGGFGSMLRAIGAQIEKTTNREACRDLSGRRLRDINEEKRLKDYLSKKVEKENEMLENKRKKLEKMKEGPKHVFEDKAYFEQREKREQDIYTSLDKAFAASAGGSKIKTDKKGKNGGPQKKLKTKMMSKLDELSSSSSEDEADEVEASRAAAREEERSEDEVSKVEGTAETDKEKTQKRKEEENEKITKLREEMKTADERIKKRNEEELKTPDEEIKTADEEMKTTDVEMKATDEEKEMRTADKESEMKPADEEKETKTEEEMEMNTADEEIKKRKEEEIESGTEKMSKKMKTN